MARIAIVTGASRGIGAATAEQLADDGWDIVVAYRSNEAAARGVVKRCADLGRQALAVRCDVAIEADVLGLFESADQLLGPVEALVNNAGVVDQPGRLDALTVERLERVLAVNVTGSFLCAREAVRRMSTLHGGRGGVIVNVSSSATRIGSPGEWVHYAASKAAIDTMTIGLAREVAAEGIRVNAVRPGLVDTDIHASVGDPGRPERMAPHIPMQRAGTAVEVASAIAWLCSDASSYVTGALLDVSGGR
jgi:NAD(P)-dependent dehydrogenase (short-subunit alcohol dehydrogenase family)